MLRKYPEAAMQAQPGIKAGNASQLTKYNKKTVRSQNKLFTRIKTRIYK
jgi:hypothetical protein